MLIYSIDFLIEKGIRTSSYREISKWNEVVVGGIEADRLIMGSSRALKHFDPRIIEEKTGKTCYNLGVDGSKYQVQKKILELYLQKNKKPKIIDWSIDFASFQKLEGIYRYEQFIPFWNEPKIKEIIALNQDMDLDYLDWPIIRFSNNPVMKNRGLLAFTPFGPWQPKIFNGYRESIKSTDDDFNQILEKENEIPNEVDDMLFKDFIQFNLMLLDQDIEIRWIISPYLRSAEQLITNKERIRGSLAHNADQLNIEFIDYSFDGLSDQQELFHNRSHLNGTGVKSFMNQLYLR